MAWPKGMKRGPRKPKELAPEVQALVDEVIAEQQAAKPDVVEKLPEPPVNEAPKRTFSKPENKWGMKGGDWGAVGDYTPDEAVVDRLHIDPSKLPDNLSYQWIPTAILGREEPQFLASAERNHWRVVHNSDFGGALDGEYGRRGSDDPVKYENMVLVARPKEYSDRARQEEMKKAQEQANLKMGALMSGQIPGVTGASHKAALATNKIGKSWERVAVPDDK